MLARDPAAEREPIAAITDRATVKVKTADRRGALWQDEDGTWWLLAAGRRKNDGPGDFYREIARYSNDSDPIAPTEVDRRYHRYETAYIGECDAERDAQATVIRALLDAAADPGTAHSVDVLGAVVPPSRPVLAGGGDPLAQERKKPLHALLVGGGRVATESLPTCREALNASIGSSRHTEPRLDLRRATGHEEPMEALERLHIPAADRGRLARCRQPAHDPVHVAGRDLPRRAARRCEEPLQHARAILDPGQPAARRSWTSR